jgi:hypothetical protein
VADGMIRDTGDLKRLIKDLAGQADGKQLRQEFNREVRDVLRPVVDEVKTAYRAAPSQQGSARRRGGSLRGALAKAATMQVRTTGKQAGVSVGVRGKRMPSGMRSLPRYVEATKPRWRHPVYGDRDVWVDQAAWPTATPVVEAHEPRVVAAVNRAADKVRRKLEGGR